MRKEILLERVLAVRGTFTSYFDRGFMAGLEGDDSSQVPEFENDLCRGMWFEGWNLAKSCLMDPEV